MTLLCPSACSRVVVIGWVAECNIQDVGNLPGLFQCADQHLDALGAGLASASHVWFDSHEVNHAVQRILSHCVSLIVLDDELLQVRKGHTVSQGGVTYEHLLWPSPHVGIGNVELDAPGDEVQGLGLSRMEHRLLLGLPACCQDRSVELANNPLGACDHLLNYALGLAALVAAYEACPAAHDPVGHQSARQRVIVV